MYAVICSSKIIGEIETLVTEKGEQILLKSIDGEEDLAEVFEKLGRISVKYLIIELSQIEDEKIFLNLMKKYRLFNDKTNIIIIAANYNPPNKLLGFLVSMGIYNIVAPKCEDLEELKIKEILNEVIEKPYTYKKAVKWFLDSDVNFDDLKNSRTKTKVQIKTKTEFKTTEITKEKIVGTIEIAVTGIMNRIGTTHAAISISKFLANNRFKVALIEAHPSENFDQIYNSYEDVKNNGEYFSLDNLDFYPYSENLDLLNILQEGYNYVILDMGTYEKCDITEFKRSNFKIVVSGVKDWEFAHLESILMENDSIEKNTYYFNFCNDTLFDTVRANMKDLKCFKAEYNPDPFYITKESATIFKELLKGFMPVTNTNNSNKKNNLIFNFLRKKERAKNET